ncbi:Tubulin-specific chaperone E [Merluccius polli]|uniref:Tubulin-specific chaperone E n=1 Tax=Merluccius polli TaxID=89951 RepID=A0AA47NQ52_MERPO|nr:Tubulin-specific chaperone E [Merluccius polli]
MPAAGGGAAGMPPAEALGRRLCCEGERGTVRYVGAVPPTAGLWLGVEWDNAERGKHDGSHEGVQYFTCRHPSGGSFVRPQKASFGVDLVSAMQDLYQFNVQEVFAQPATISSRTVEVSGFARLDSLEVVSLRQREVSSPGPRDQIQTLMHDVRSLDLSGNLLSSWQDVAGITENMEHLRELLLSFNRLSLTSDPKSLSHAFSNLTVLSLAGCQLTWTQLLQCAPMWPRLEELYVSENDITELSRPLDLLQDLKVLDLSSNPLVQDSVLNLAHLPRLENLNLSRTALSDLQFHDVPPGGKTRMFTALKVLILNHNNIAQWSVVNELDKLQSLVELSCRHNNQLTNDLTPQTANQLITAKLAQLAILNKSRVLQEDRRGAELDYIKMFGEEWLKSGGHRDPAQNQPSAQFTSMHPRYLPLIQKYGAPEEGELKKQAPFALKNQLISVTIVCPEEEGRMPTVKKLPDSMTVQKVKGLLSRMLKVPGAAITLTYTGPKMNGSEVDLDNDLKPLQFYSIEDGDSLLVRRA